jgi:SAM-dependent methyltransferase
MMTNESLMVAAVRLSLEMETLAALGAHLRIETEDLDADPDVRRLLAVITEEVVGAGSANGPAAGAVVGMVRSLMRQAIDLVDSPDRGGRWVHVDEELLQGVGRLSMAITTAFAAAERSLDGFREAMTAPGARFLDVGTGTGWLAVATARAYPAASIVGIDPFTTALELARSNVAAEGLAERIELRHLDVLELAEDSVYDAIWLPLPFLPRAVVIESLAGAVRALRPGGWLLPGTFAGPDDRRSQLLVDLRTVRAGGHPWRPEEIVRLLGEHGLEHAGEVTRTWPAPVRLYAGRRPAE